MSSAQSEQSGLDAALLAARRGWFGALFLLAKESKASTAAFVITTVSDLLQFSVFPVITAVALSADRGYSLTATILSVAILDVDTLVGLAWGNSGLLRGLLFWFAIAIVIVFLGLLGFVMGTLLTEGRQQAVVLRALASMASVLTTVAFMPLASVLLAIFHDCSSISALGVECNTDGQWIVTALVVLLLGVFSAVATFFATVYIDTDLKSTALGAKVTGRLDAVMLLAKLVLVSLFAVADLHPVAQTVFSGIAALIWFCGTLFVQPYVRPTANGLAAAAAALNLWLVLCLVVKLVDPSASTQAFMVMGVLLAPPVGFFANSAYANSVAQSDFSSLHSAVQADIWARHRISLAQHLQAAGGGRAASRPQGNASSASAPASRAGGRRMRARAAGQPRLNDAKPSQLRRAASAASMPGGLQASSGDGRRSGSGVSKIHVLTDGRAGDSPADAAVDAAPITTSELMPGVTAEGLIEQASVAYDEMLKAWPKSAVTYSSGSIFHRAYGSTASSELTILAMARKQVGSAWDVSFLSYQRTRQLQERSASGLSAMDRILFDDAWSAAVEDSLACFALQHAMWNHAIESNPDAAVLGGMAEDLFKARTAAERRFRTMLQINPDSIMALRAYSRFCDDVLGDADRATELMNKANRIEDKHAKTNVRPLDAVVVGDAVEPLSVMDEMNAVITMTGELRRCGEITDANVATARLFGRGRSDLVGQSLASLFPEPLGSLYDAAILAYLSPHEKGEAFSRGAHVSVVQTAGGWLAPVRVSLQEGAGSELDSTPCLSLVVQLAPTQCRMMVVGDAESGFPVLALDEESMALLTPHDGATEWSPSSRRGASRSRGLGGGKQAMPGTWDGEASLADAGDPAEDADGQGLAMLRVGGFSGSFGYGPQLSAPLVNWMPGLHELASAAIASASGARGSVVVEGTSLNAPDASPESPCAAKDLMEDLAPAQRLAVSLQPLHSGTLAGRRPAPGAPPQHWLVTWENPRGHRNRRHVADRRVLGRAASVDTAAIATVGAARSHSLGISSAAQRLRQAVTDRRPSAQRSVGSASTADPSAASANLLGGASQDDLRVLHAGSGASGGLLRQSSCDAKPWAGAAVRAAGRGRSKVGPLSASCGVLEDEALPGAPLAGSARQHSASRPTRKQQQLQDKPQGGPAREAPLAVTSGLSTSSQAAPSASWQQMGSRTLESPTFASSGRDEKGSESEDARGVPVSTASSQASKGAGGDGDRDLLAALDEDQFGHGIDMKRLTDATDGLSGGIGGGDGMGSVASASATARGLARKVTEQALSKSDPLVSAIRTVVVFTLAVVLCFAVALAVVVPATDAEAGRLLRASDLAQRRAYHADVAMGRWFQLISVSIGFTFIDDWATLTSNLTQSIDSLENAHRQLLEVAQIQNGALRHFEQERTWQACTSSNQLYVCHTHEAMSATDLVEFTIFHLRQLATLPEGSLTTRDPSTGKVVDYHPSLYTLVPNVDLTAIALGRARQISAQALADGIQTQLDTLTAVLVSAAFLTFAVVTLGTTALVSRVGRMRFVLLASVAQIQHKLLRQLVQQTELAQAAFSTAIGADHAEDETAPLADCHDVSTPRSGTGDFQEGARRAAQAGSQKLLLASSAPATFQQDPSTAAAQVTRVRLTVAGGKATAPGSKPRCAGLPCCACGARLPRCRRPRRRALRRVSDSSCFVLKKSFTLTAPLSLVGAWIAVILVLISAMYSKVVVDAARSERLQDFATATSALRSRLEVSLLLDGPSRADALVGVRTNATKALMAVGAVLNGAPNSSFGAPMPGLAESSGEVSDTLFEILVHDTCSALPAGSFDWTRCRQLHDRYGLKGLHSFTTAMLADSIESTAIFDETNQTDMRAMADLLASGAIFQVVPPLRRYSEKSAMAEVMLRHIVNITADSAIERFETTWSELQLAIGAFASFFVLLVWLWALPAVASIDRSRQALLELMRSLPEEVIVSTPAVSKVISDLAVFVGLSHAARALKSVVRASRIRAQAEYHQLSAKRAALGKRASALKAAPAPALVSPVGDTQSGAGASAK
ncbi:hypothetical protein FNF27_07706 [Cafeteria roenbergensis]|uniref:TmcB/TmcC TPR repeats domain-containing protein n=1 Tax=Cafeteria roenbergensis TaxID=33653 RepID=A0A5A8DK33_CAFRO|nr:hypothetical protein FNF27_07706 [Cafeteria roenbergensis]